MLSVRTLLVLILALAVWLGWWANGARNQRAAVAAVTKEPYFANVMYEEEFAQASFSGLGGGRVGSARREKSWVPASGESWLGKDYFHNVSAIAFSKDGNSAPSDDRETFRKIARVRNLDQLNPNVEVRDEDIARIARLPYLRILSLRADSPELSDDALGLLAGMPRLETLEIHNAPVTDAGLARLEGLRTLRHLLLGKAQPFDAGGNPIAITGEGFAHLTGLPALAELEVHSPALTGGGLGHLGGLRHLKRLRLRSATITDDDLRSLAGLTELESLEIFGAGIDGTGFRHLTELSKVSYVCIECPNVTDAALPFLARLPRLESVMIYNTRVTASGLEVFRSTPSLKQMGLIPAVQGDTKRLKQALSHCNVLNGGRSL